VGRRRVYRARDAATNGVVALKVVPASEVTRELAALMAARLPGVVELVDHYVDGPEATIVTRWIDGLPFPGPASTLEVVVRAATALLDVIERVHRCGVVHRDLKPTNVLVDADGRVNVLDLGIAAGAGVERHTDEGDVAGTLRYLAPRAARGHGGSPRRPLRHRRDGVRGAHGRAPARGEGSGRRAAAPRPGAGARAAARAVGRARGGGRSAGGAAARRPGSRTRGRPPARWGPARRRCCRRGGPRRGGCGRCCGARRWSASSARARRPCCGAGPGGAGSASTSCCRGGSARGWSPPSWWWTRRGSRPWRRRIATRPCWPGGRGGPRRSAWRRRCGSPSAACRRAATSAR
jgi:hypothetical protein